MELTKGEKLLHKGLHALEHGHTYLAMSFLEQAREEGESPLLSSYLAYCHALNGRNLDQAAELARSALLAEPANSECSLNLGRVLLLSGRKEEAITVFRQGLSHSVSPELIAQLDQLGARKPPTFTMLPRGHFLNKYSGKLLDLFGFK